MDNTQSTSTNNVTLASFNTKYVKSSIQHVKELCAQAQVIALQETWLFPHDLTFLGTISEDFAWTGTSAIDPTAGILRGRPHGGTALLWKKSVFPTVSVLECRNKRICGIRASLSDKSILIFSVYMPTDATRNLSEFAMCVSTLNAIIEENNVESVFILGDFNAHPGEHFGNELISFCRDHDWICADFELLGINSGTYTYVCQAKAKRSWLDHCLVTRSAMETCIKAYVKYDVYTSDHYPLIIDCDLDTIKPKNLKSNVISSKNKVLWGDKKTDQIIEFNKECNERLKIIDFPVECRYCCDNCCRDLRHRRIIDKLYYDIVSALTSASVKTSKTCKVKPKNKKQLMGWNKHVADAHRESRLRFIMWLECGKPRGGQLYDEMTDSRRLFKTRLKWCQRNQEQIEMDRLAALHAKSDFKSFWKNTKKQNFKLGLPVSVDNVTNPEKIADMFREHFTVKSDLPCLNVKNDDRSLSQGEVEVRFSAKQVRKVITNMKRGKSPGYDGLSIEHLQNAGPHLPRVLALLFGLCVGHTYLPADMTRTIVVPIIKNKMGDVSSRTNYRPISLATVLAKVLDGLLNAELDKFIQLHDAQFGFRSGLSTESAIIGLKHTVGYYTERKTQVFATPFSDNSDK